MTLKAAVAQGEKLLKDSGIPAARLTAEVLLAHALGQERIYLITHAGDPLTDIVRIHFGRYLHERVQGKPTQYITKKQEFYGRNFYVAPGVLIPRPETELLVEALVTRLRPAERVVDVGVGSGCIAITLALETRARLFACDISRDALRIAARNCGTWQAPVSLIEGDLLQAFGAGCLDAVVSNPPYIPEGERGTLAREVRDWEPAGALFAGAEGMDAYRRLIPDAARVLRPGGLLAFEFGFGQASAIEEALQGWREVEIHSDLAGIPRFALARRSSSV